MLVIRLFRVGKKNQPFFKIVVTDKRKPPRAGRFVEEVGFYNPLTKEKNIKKERVKYWLSVGAKPSDTVHNLLISEKIIEEKKIPKHKKPPKESKLPTGQAKKEKGTPVPSPPSPAAEAGIPEKPAPASADLASEAFSAKEAATAGKEKKPVEKETEKTPKEKISEEKPAKEKPTPASAKGHSTELDRSPTACKEEKIERKPPKEKVPKEKSPEEKAKGKEERKAE